MNATSLAIVTGVGVLLWLATDQFVLLVLGVLLGLALAFGLHGIKKPPGGR